MKRGRQSYIADGALALMFVCVILCSRSPVLGEWYARNLYPTVSLALSFVSAAVPISLDEVFVIGAVACMIIALIVAIVRHCGWKKIVLNCIRCIVGIYVWFYFGWGMNYFRYSIYERASVKRAAYNEAAFKEFLSEYTERLNENYVEAFDLEQRYIETNIKSEYDKVNKKYGLTKAQAFQHPKRSVCNGLYSSVGVLGYMGPFFCESHLNHDLLPNQLPFTYAHELSHLLSVSNEAEANWWAYKVCTSSSDTTIRYSGYYGIFGYVIKNARRLLSKEDYKTWVGTVRDEIKDDFMQQQEYWHDKYSPTIGKIQDWVYDLFLKGNKIKTGKQNYAEVVGIIMSIKEEG